MKQPFYDKIQGTSTDGTFSGSFTDILKPGFSLRIDTISFFYNEGQQVQPNEVFVAYTGDATDIANISVLGSFGGVTGQIGPVLLKEPKAINFLGSGGTVNPAGNPWIVEIRGAIVETFEAADDPLPTQSSGVTAPTIAIGDIVRPPAPPVGPAATIDVPLTAQDFSSGDSLALRATNLDSSVVYRITLVQAFNGFVNTDVDNGLVFQPPASDQLSGAYQVVVPYLHYTDAILSRVDGNNLVNGEELITWNAPAAPDAPYVEWAPKVASHLDINNETGDAFGRLRTSQPFNLFENVFEYGLNEFLWDTITTGSGSVTWNAASSSVTLSTGGTVGSSACIQTHNYFRYQPDKSHLIRMTGRLSVSTQIDHVTEFGYGDDNNGCFWIWNAPLGGTPRPGIRVRSNVSGSVVNTDVLQNAWNLDTLDGLGPSRALVDFSQAQQFVIDLQWLSIGRVRFGIVTGGRLIYCHEQRNSNILLPYMATPNLPLRYKITNNASIFCTALAICAALTSEGGSEIHGFPFSASGGLKTLTTGATIPLLSVAMQSTFGGKTNKALLLPTEISLYADNPVYLVVYLNGSLTGAVFNASSDNNSLAAFDTSATAISGNSIIYQGLVPGAGKTDAVITSNASNLLQRKLSNSAAGVSDVLSICARRINAVNTAVTCTANWLEQRA